MASRSLGAVQQLAQLLAGLEVRHRLGGNHDALAPLGVAPGAALAPPHAEAAEAPQLDLVPALQGLDDRREDGVDDDLGVLAGEGGLAPDLVHELGFGHRLATPSRTPSGRPAGRHGTRRRVSSDRFRKSGDTSARPARTRPASPRGSTARSSSRLPAP